MSLFLFLLVGLMLILINPSNAISYGSCNGTMFFCPTASSSSSSCENNVDDDPGAAGAEAGAFVSDCFSCQGYMSSDPTHNICFDRRLFQRHNIDPNDPDHHYHFLWNDLVGAVVWFLTAGICKYISIISLYARYLHSIHQSSLLLTYAFFLNNTTFGFLFFF